MRLIDADKLLTHIEDFGEGQYRLDLIDPYYVRNAPTVDAIPLPDEATNGEVIMALFPNTNHFENNGIMNTDIDGGTLFNEDWWNAPYNGGNENE